MEKEINKLNKEFIDNFHPNKMVKTINSYLKKAYNDYFDDITFSIMYFDCISNSHTSPINGITNFRREKDKPVGYPGFQGHISGLYSKNNKSFCEYTGGWNETLIPCLHTGTGAGGSDWRYSFYFFLQDFPNFQKEFEKRHLVQQAKELLNGNYHYIIQEIYDNYTKIF